MKFLVHIILVVLHASLGNSQSVKSLGVSEGLSSGFIYDVIQAKEGYIFFGTKTGLNRYDGYEVKQYKNDIDDEFSLFGSHVKEICEDNRGFLWLSIDQKTLNIYYQKTNKFYNITGLSKKGNNVENYILKLYSDPENRLWLITSEHEVFQVFIPEETIANSKSNEIAIDEYIEKKYVINNKNIYKQTSFFNSIYYEFGIDNNNQLWLASSAAQLFKIDSQHNNITLVHEGRFSDISKTPNIVQVNETRTIVRQGDKWIKIENERIEEFDIPNQLVDHVFFTIPNVKKLVSVKRIKNTVKHKLYFIEYDDLTNQEFQLPEPLDVLKIKSDLLIDKSNVLWVPSLKKAYFFNINNQVFKHELIGKSIYNIDQLDECHIMYKHLYSMFLFDLESKKTKQFSDKFPKIDFSIADVKLTPNKKLYGIKHVFTGEGGKGENQLINQLFIYNIINEELQKFSLDTIEEFKLSFIDQKERWWFINNGIQLGYFDYKEKKYHKVYEFNNCKTLENNSIINTLFSDIENNLWIGTSDGFIKTNTNSFPKIEFKYEHVKTPIKRKRNLNSDYIKCFIDDPINPHHIIWIGTKDGLKRYNKITGEQNIISPKSSNLPDGVIYQIQTDANNNFWISTNKGISKYNPNLNTFDNFEKNDGLQDLEFNTYSSAKLFNGNLVFGGVNGLNIFTPKRSGVDSTTAVPPLLTITDVKVNNKTYSRQNPNALKQLTLDYNQNNIQVQFAAMDFTNPKKNSFKYIFSKNNKVDELKWIDLYNENKLQFFGLSPSTYFLHIKAANSKNIWNSKYRTITIVINPPWWKSNIACFVYSVLLMIFIYSMYMAQVRRNRLRTDLEYKKKETSKFKELDKIKSQFFSNITHEFRTPLTLIIEPIRQVIALNKDNKLESKLKVASQNSERLLTLINQLLDISKLESGKLKCDFRKGELLHIVNKVVELFIPQPETKGIAINVVIRTRNTVLVYDKYHIEKVLSNLLSNAIKFTRDGKITISISEVKTDNSESIKLDITDTGVGIARIDQKKIFNRFYQSGIGDTNIKIGTGIGLSLVNELMKLHQGSISLKSELGKGSKFTIEIPKNLKVTDTDNEIVTYESNCEELANDDNGSFFVLDEKSRAQKEIVLVIEDNIDLLNFIKETLDSNYNVLTAKKWGEWDIAC